MEDFSKKYRCLFETECVPAPNGECLVWPRKPKKNGYGAVKIQMSLIWPVAMHNCTSAYLHGL